MKGLKHLLLHLGVHFVHRNISTINLLYVYLFDCVKLLKRVMTGMKG